MRSGELIAPSPQLRVNEPAQSSRPSTSRGEGRSKRSDSTIWMRRLRTAGRLPHWFHSSLTGSKSCPLVMEVMMMTSGSSATTCSLEKRG